MPASHRSRWLAKLLALAVVYFATARLGLMLDAVSGFATLVWPPTGIALVALLVGGDELWPAVTVGAFAVNLVTGAPPAVALGIALGNTLEALAGVALLRRLDFRTSLDRLDDVLSLTLAALAAPAISASIGVLSLIGGGVILAAAAGDTLRAWWLGDALGILLLAPALFVLATRPWVRPRGSAPEAVGLVALIALSSALVFGSWLPTDNLGLLKQAYLVYPPLIWAALRFRQVGTTLALLLVGTLAVAGTVTGGGPFVRAHLSDSLLLLQSFLGFTSVTTLLLAAAVAERDRSLEETKLALQSRDEFLSIAAHELRTPLTAMKIKIRIMEKAASAGMPEKLLESAGGVSRLVDRFDQLIGGLLDVTRAVSGRLALDPEDTDLRLVVDEVVERHKESAFKAGSVMSVKGDESCVGRWDRLRLDQIVTNLVTNAIKYGAGRPIEVQIASSDSGATLVVRDHGIGVAEEDRARIFERFERASPSKRMGGLGLGLWIVRQIVEAMGGSIAVQSELGRGAEFRVALPRTSGT